MDATQAEAGSEDRLRVSLVFEPAVAALAQRVAAGLAQQHAVVSLAPVDAVSPHDASAADLLVIGSPVTSLHSLRPGLPAPRRSPEDVGFVSMREWLAALPAPRAPSRAPPRPMHCPCFVAAFDARHTRAGRHHATASSQAAWVLTRRGFELAGWPISFLLDGLTDDPATGECARAEHWGLDVAELTLARIHGDQTAWWAHSNGTDHSTTVPPRSPRSTRH